MVRAHLVSVVARHAFALAWVFGLTLMASAAHAQSPPFSPTGKHIVDVRIVNNRAVSIPEIRGELKTRVGQAFADNTVVADVRALTETRKIYHVKVKTQPGPQPGTVVVTFQIFEFPKVEYVKFHGNGIRDKSLRGAIALKEGDPLDVVSVESARDEIVAFYKERGYNEVKVEIREGAKKSDRGVVFVISDGPQQRVWNVDFVGNTIVSGGRLKTQIQSKPSWIKYTMFGKGYVDLKKIDADVEKIESYYRDLGFMLARVGRELRYNDDKTQLDITFVIDEGPRFRVRDVVIRGTQVFAAQKLEELLELHSGEYYDGPSMQQDVAKLTEIYGAVGYVMVDVRPSPRTLQEVPEIDLVYDIEEGKRYRVGRINVNIGGDDPHTRLSVAMNRLSLRPGDIMDIRKIRDSERRLRASGLFAVDPVRGLRPEIVYTPRKTKEVEGLVKRPRATTARGQSPDGPLVQIEIVPTDPLPPRQNLPAYELPPQQTLPAYEPPPRQYSPTAYAPVANRVWRNQ